MSEERLKELQDFVDEFHDQLKEAKEIYQQKQEEAKTLNKEHLKPENIRTKLYAKKNLKTNKLAEKLKMDQHWVPNCLFGKSFEKFKKMTYGHFPTSWEIVHNNINLIFIYIGKNSFTKKIL
jgi:hypothetical protein